MKCKNDKCNNENNKCSEAIISQDGDRISVIPVLASTPDCEPSSSRTH
jgi:hypothetical protein